ncbi:universal stress protein [Flavobacteriales bacterium]|nr:universal stress protein [Flavobacteriales bacterium]
MSNQDKLGSILVPVDFSEQSEVALEQAVSLSRVFNSEIHVLNVINEEFSLSKLFDDSDKIQYKKRIKERLDAFVKAKNAEFGIELKSIQVTGKIYSQVVNSADVIDAEFIVMGTSGSSTLKKRFIGSNALRVVRESHKPVITIKGKHHRKGCQNIVLPLDLTKETKEKVAKAVEFAKRFGSIIRVVSVLRTNDEFIVNRLTRQLDQVKKYVVEQGVECGAEIIRDTKGEHTLAASIIDYANRIKGDLIMLMTQQEQDITEFFIGSSAQEVINTSDIPVLSIVPTPKKDTTSFTPY